MRYALTLVAPPTAEPVTLAEAKAQLKVDASADDALITSLITAARQQAEETGAFGFSHGRALVTQTLALFLDGFPDADGAIEVPRPPLASVTSITYVDTAGTTQTLASSDYTVDAKSKPGRVAPAFGKSWPATRDVINAVTVTFDAGYGTAAAVPESIKREIKALLVHLYERREEFAPPYRGWSLA